MCYDGGLARAPVGVRPVVSRIRLPAQRMFHPTMGCLAREHSDVDVDRRHATPELSWEREIMRP